MVKWSWDFKRVHFYWFVKCLFGKNLWCLISRTGLRLPSTPTTSPALSSCPSLHSKHRLCQPSQNQARHSPFTHGRSFWSQLGLFFFVNRWILLSPFNITYQLSRERIYLQIGHNLHYAVVNGHQIYKNIRPGSMHLDQYLCHAESLTCPIAVRPNWQGLNKQGAVRNRLNVANWGVLLSVVFYQQQSFPCFLKVITHCSLESTLLKEENT